MAKNKKKSAAKPKPTLSEPKLALSEVLDALAPNIGGKDMETPEIAAKNLLPLLTNNEAMLSELAKIAIDAIDIEQGADSDEVFEVVENHIAAQLTEKKPPVSTYIGGEYGISNILASAFPNHQFVSRIIPDEDMDRILPVVDQRGSDSAMLDNTLEFMYMNGMDLPLAMMITIPEPWKHNGFMSQKKKDFYHYLHLCVIDFFIAM